LKDFPVSAKEFKQENKGSLINFNEADARIDFQKKFGKKA
jgi:hypothetical protein